MMAVEVTSNPKMFDCDSCRTRHCSESTRAAFDVWTLKLGTTSMPMRVCPKPKLTQTSLDWLSLHAHYRRGHLLAEGGIEDQPYRYLQAMRLIDNQVISHAE